MNIGYARVSTVDQNLALQRDALSAAECEHVFADEGVSGSVIARPGLDAALAALQTGDTLVVWKLDRLGRSLAHLVGLVADLGARGINFRSIADPIDTTSASGRLILHIMGALAEFERSLIVDRTQAGLRSAKNRGVRLGRRRSLTAAQVKHARSLIAQGEAPRAVARTMNVGKSTLYRALNATADAARFSMPQPKAKLKAPSSETKALAAHDAQAAAPEGRCGKVLEDVG